MVSRTQLPAITQSLILLASVGANAQSPFYTDTGSPSNPLWGVIKPTLNNGTADSGPVNGSVINVNNAATEVGLYGNRPISVGTQRIHVCCNTSTTNLGDFSRWFQTDGNTQVFRLFVNDENTATSRAGAARCEAFTVGGWTYADNVTYEWTGRYTIARRQETYSIFQLFNLDNEWAMNLTMTPSGQLLLKNRRNAPDVRVTNPDGSTKSFDGKGFDVRVIDDGRNYKCWIDGSLVADNFYHRPTAISRFRWGKYRGSGTLTSPSDVSVILVSGAQVKSWPGRLDSATTDIVKANNSQFLGNTASWTQGKLPGIHNRAVWNSTVTTTNSTTLNTQQTWGGIRITNPGGNVTIKGDSILKLEDKGIDLGSATRDLTVNCPVEPNVTTPWVIASGRTATFNAPIRGYQGIELSGNGTLTLNASNTYTGPTAINGGVLQVGNVSPFNNTPLINMSDGSMLRPTIGGATILAPIYIGPTGTTASISAPTNLPGAGAVSTLALERPITGNGGVIFTGSANQNALSTILLNAVSTYNGPTLIDTGGTNSSQIVVRLGRSNALPTGTALSIDGQAGEGTGRYADLNLNGFSQQLGGLTNTPRDLRIQRIVNSNVSAAATLTVNNAANHTFSGSLGGSTAGSVSGTAMPGSNGGNNFAMTKLGTGTLTLTGSNSYSGNTTVNQGILSLASANENNQASAVIIAATGATLNLAFTGTDTVNELFIGATRKPPGVYEAVGNPGNGNEIAQITGTGTLTVTTGSAPPLVGYDAWKETNGTTQPFDGDHDNDGVPNGIEYFLGGNGNTTGHTKLPAIANPAGIFHITWTKGNGYSGNYGSGFVIETSGSLTGTWTGEAAAPAPNATVTFPSANTVRYTFPFPATGKRFARLKVLAP